MSTPQDEESVIYIPIPHYPPFKLRSSLIDKDPVIWVHLLEAYIQLFKYLVNPEVQVKKLNVKSQQQLQHFLKVFLFETSEETTKIFSLGAINPDITTNTAVLRAYVFELVRTHSLVRLNLTGESIWHFVTVYARANSSVVRGLVDGTFKSKFNDNKKSGNISFIDTLQKHLEQLISNGHFKHQDLVTLSYLLGQHTGSASKVKTFNITGAASNNPKSKTISKSPNSSLQFAEKFVNIAWIELLEKLYVNGRSVHAKTIENIMIVSLLSLSNAKVANLVTGLGINHVSALILSPLLAIIIISDGYRELSPGLEERLPFLRKLRITDNEPANGDFENEAEFEANPDHLGTLQDLFPQMNDKQAVTILKENNGDVEHVINILLENPDQIASIKEYVPVSVRKLAQSKAAEEKMAKELEKAKKRFKDHSEDSVVQRKRVTVNKDARSPEDLKKKTLSAALKLMYEDDEDEPDDTYEDQEKTTGAAFDDGTDKHGKKRGGSRLKVLVDDEDVGSTGEQRQETPPPERPESRMEAIERYLFSVYKTKGEANFDKTSRKSSVRQTMKQSTGWSDEQIEGWLRMLHRSPKRYKLLEEYFLFGGGNPNRAPVPPPLSKQQGPSSKQQGLEPSQSRDSDKKSHKSPTPGQGDSSANNNNSNDKTKAKRSQARNEKNKSTRANHSRKTGHNKKMASQMAGMQ